MYKGYAGSGPQPGQPPSWIFTAPLADCVRNLRPKVSGELLFLACTVYKMRKRMGLIKPRTKTMSPKHPWTKRELALLDTGPDKVEDPHYQDI